MRIAMWNGGSVEVPELKKGAGLLALPALIDPHVHFRVPGAEYKEDWKSGAAAAIAGGVTTVFDMPNNLPPCVTSARLEEKRAEIERQLAEGGVPLRYGLYLGADRAHFEEIERVEGRVVGIKVFMGCSTGDMCMDAQEDLEELFRRAKQHELVVAVHAEDECRIRARKALFAGESAPATHSKIRDATVALLATQRAIACAEKFGTRLYLVHISTAAEVECIREAKRRGVDLFAEVSPNHLFLTEEEYATWGTFVQMNPPLRTARDREALWQGLREGVLDTIGTDHAPHTQEEKRLPFGKAPSGIPGVETSLPLMLDAVSKGWVTLPRLVEVMRTSIERLFRLPSNDDLVLVDLAHLQEVKRETLKTKCQWSPYVGRSLKGWPIYTYLRGRLYPAAGHEEWEKNQIASS